MTKADFCNFEIYFLMFLIKSSKFQTIDIDMGFDAKVCSRCRGSITVIFVKVKNTVKISNKVGKNRHFQICYFEFAIDGKVCNMGR